MLPNMKRHIRIRSADYRTEFLFGTQKPEIAEEPKRKSSYYSPPKQKYKILSLQFDGQ